MRILLELGSRLSDTRLSYQDPAFSRQYILEQWVKKFHLVEDHCRSLLISSVLIDQRGRLRKKKGNLSIVRL